VPWRAAKCHFQAAGFLLHNKKKSIVIFMPKILLWTQPQVDLIVTITRQVVVYAPPAKKAEKLLSFLFYPCLLWGCSPNVIKKNFR
jgi:hypothetical protein